MRKYNIPDPSRPVGWSCSNNKQRCCFEFRRVIYWIQEVPLMSRSALMTLHDLLRIYVHIRCGTRVA